MSSVLLFNKDSFLALLFLTKPNHFGREGLTDKKTGWTPASLSCVRGYSFNMARCSSWFCHRSRTLTLPSCSLYFMMLREWLIGASGLLLRTGFDRLKANAAGPGGWRIPLKVQINLKMARRIVEPIAKFKVGFLLISEFKLKYDITVHSLKFRTQRV